MYRSRPTRLEDGMDEVHPRSGIRPPAYVSYLVDNLWEWKRPEAIPSRRNAIFACPSRELALCVPGNNFVYKIQLSPGSRIFQLTSKGEDFDTSDAKYHPDCKRLPKLFIDMLGKEWLKKDVAAKIDVGRLYIPCLQKKDMEEIFSEGILMDKRKEIEDSIRYWDCIVEINDHALADPNGEVLIFTDAPYMLTEC